jgi:hypothetical protein
VINVASGATFNDQTTSYLNITASNRGVTDDGATAAVNNAGTFEKTGSATISTISVAFNNTGTVSVQAGMLDLDGAVTGTGAETVSGGSTLRFDSTVASAQIVGFAGSGGTINLNDPQGFSAEISNFAAADAINLLGSWGFSSFTENSGGTLGTLTLTNGTNNLALNFTGNYTAADFNLHESGGSTIVAHT